MSVLSLNNICFSYDRTPVLQNISYDFEEGKMYCISGKSGAGKTTLLSVLSGLAEPNSGSICYDGNRFYHQPPHWLETVVDTMGAGDAFISAFLYQFIDNGGYEAEDKSEIITKALEFAADYSAKSCMVEGSFGHGVPFKD